jgi:hypothetical protein
MKSNTNIQKKKHYAPTPQQGKQPAGRPATDTPRRSLRGLLIGILCTLLVGGGTWALFEYVIWNVTPPELVGKWVVVDGEQEGATFDIFRSGALVGKINIDGREAIVNARIRMEGKKLYWHTRSKSGQEDTRVKVIRTLTVREMVWEDEQGSVLKMERAD